MVTPIVKNLPSVTPKIQPYSTSFAASNCWWDPISSWDGNARVWKTESFISQTHTSDLIRHKHYSNAPQSYIVNICKLVALAAVHLLLRGLASEVDTGTPAFVYPFACRLLVQGEPLNADERKVNKDSPKVKVAHTALVWPHNGIEYPRAYLSKLVTFMRASHTKDKRERVT